MENENKRHGLGIQPFNTCPNSYAIISNHKQQLLRNIQWYISIENNFLFCFPHNIYSFLKCCYGFPYFYGNKVKSKIKTFTCSKLTFHCNTRVVLELLCYL